MTSTAPTALNVGNDRQNLILNALLASITCVPTDWQDISKSVEAQVKIRSNGWGAVRGLLQWLMNNGFVARAPFDPNAGECYVLLPN